MLVNADMVDVVEGNRSISVASCGEKFHMSPTPTPRRRKYLFRSYSSSLLDQSSHHNEWDELCSTPTRINKSSVSTGSRSKKELEAVDDSGIDYSYHSPGFVNLADMCAPSPHVKVHGGGKDQDDAPNEAVALSSPKQYLQLDFLSMGGQEALPSVYQAPISSKSSRRVKKSLSRLLVSARSSGRPTFSPLAKGGATAV
jgi:hypothetical protein